MELSHFDAFRYFSAMGNLSPVIHPFLPTFELWLIFQLYKNTVFVMHSIYSNNLVRTDHVCSCLVTSAAREWINQSCDDHYLVYRFAAYQRDTG